MDNAKVPEALKDVPDHQEAGEEVQGEAVRNLNAAAMRVAIALKQLLQTAARVNEAEPPTVATALQPQIAEIIHQPPKPDAGRAITPEQAEEAARWAAGLAHSAPIPDPAKLREEQRKFAERRKLIEWLYNQTQQGMRKHRSATPAQLKKANEGDGDGENRVPLQFGTRNDGDAMFARFKSELGAIFESNGITDATVQAIGSGTMGWKGNPHKEVNPNKRGKEGGEWMPTSDMDFAIFSRQMLHMAMTGGAVVNKKIQMAGKYTVFKNEAPGGHGVDDTPVGKLLKAFSRKWNKEIYGAEDVDGVDFKLNTTTKPFSGALTVYRGSTAGAAEEGESASEGGDSGDTAFTQKPGGPHIILTERNRAKSWKCDVFGIEMPQSDTDRPPHIVTPDVNESNIASLGKKFFPLDLPSADVKASTEESGGFALFVNVIGLQNGSHPAHLTMGWWKDAGPAYEACSRLFGVKRDVAGK
jgi:hypothetical protein